MEVPLVPISFECAIKMKFGQYGKNVKYVFGLMLETGN